METKNMKKYIWIFLLCCLPVSNVLWYIAYSAGDESVSTSFVILTSFLPALTALVLCKISKEGWNNLKILPNIREAWKVYLFAVIGALVMNYLNELLLALVRTIWHLGILVFFPHPLIGLCDLFLSNLLSQGFLIYLTKRSSSLFPAAVVHAVTNLLPAFVAYNDSFYQAHIVPMNCAGLISAAVVGGISCLLMQREEMFVQGTERTEGTI